MSGTLKNRNLGNKQRDLRDNLIEKDFVHNIKEETDKMNKTYNNKYILSRRNSGNNFANTGMSVVNFSNTKSKFYKKINKKRINYINANRLNYNSDYIENSNLPSIGGPELRRIDFNKYIEIKNQKQNILNSIEIRNFQNRRSLFNQNILSDNIYYAHEINPINGRNKNKIYINNEREQTENEQFINKEDFFIHLNETKENINELYLKLNKKIRKLTRQIKNLAAEIFKYYFTQRLNNKYSLFVTNGYTPRYASINTGKDLLQKTKEIKSRKLNLKFFSDINGNLNFTEEQKLNSKELLKKIDSFLIKKFKES